MAVLAINEAAGFFVPTNKNVFPFAAYLANCNKDLFKQVRVFKMLIIWRPLFIKGLF